MEAGECGRTRGTCFIARRFEVVAVAGLLWISWCVSVGADLFVFFFFFERTRPAASVRPPCLICLSTKYQTHTWSAPPPITASFVNTTVVTRGWVGVPSERAPLIFHGEVVGFVDRCLSRTRNLAASSYHLSMSVVAFGRVFLRPILAQGRLHTWSNSGVPRDVCSPAKQRKKRMIIESCL